MDKNCFSSKHFILRVCNNVTTRSYLCYTNLNLIFDSYTCVRRYIIIMRQDRLKITFIFERNKIKFELNKTFVYEYKQCKLKNLRKIRDVQ